MKPSQAPRKRGRPHVSWNTEDRWFLIQLALLAKELKFVETDPDLGAVVLNSPEMVETPTTRTPRSNHGAARFAFYWAHGAEPHVDDETDPSKPTIGFSPFDDRVEAIETCEADITRTRRALDGDFHRYLDGDLLAQGSRHTTDLILDDLFDTGATMDAVCKTLRTYKKVNHVYAASITWK
jgi:hypothetical protein